MNWEYTPEARIAHHEDMIQILQNHERQCDAKIEQARREFRKQYQTKFLERSRYHREYIKRLESEIKHLKSTSSRVPPPPPMPSTVKAPPPPPMPSIKASPPKRHTSPPPRKHVIKTSEPSKQNQLIAELKKRFQNGTKLRSIN